MSEKKSRKFNWYFKIDTQSVQGRVTIPFVLVGLLMGIIIYVGDYYRSMMDSEKDRILNNVKPVATESIQLRSLIKQTQANLSYYLYNVEDDSTLDANKNLWAIDIRQQKDLLQGAIRRAQSPEASLIFTTVSGQINELNRLEEEIEKLRNVTQNNKIIRYKVKNELLFTVQSIDNGIKKLIAIAHSQEGELLRTLEVQRLWFYRILLAVLVIGFVICYAVGLQMFVGIFSWFREVRDKFREISYGNLPEPFTVRNNELHGITRYGNRLIDNLTALKGYALEVGEGNFSLQTKIFGSNSTLGRSLNEMSQSLQRVYDEERKRNWITEGLAEFSEIFRTHSQNSEMLSRETLRALVAHLEIIQGGVFILDREIKPPVFELKASYAYGREKFIQKTIDAQEGLLGRVYMEKEKVILRDIPNNYLEITSGLGSTKPNTLILLPLLNDEQDLMGVLELTSLNELEEYQIDFLEKLCGSLASTITIVLAGQRNEKLLIESQKFAESLSKKEEEARIIVRELTEVREEAERRLRTIELQNQKMIAIFQNISEAVILTDLEGKIEFFNQSAEKIFGFRYKEILGRNIRLILTVDDVAESDIFFQDYLNVQEAALLRTEHQVEAIRKDSTRLSVNLTMSEIEVNFTKYLVRIVKEQ
jgi:PAS domain S-box-containing protein